MYHHEAVSLIFLDVYSKDMVHLADLNFWLIAGQVHVFLLKGMHGGRGGEMLCDGRIEPAKHWNAR